MLSMRRNVQSPAQCRSDLFRDLASADGVAGAKRDRRDPRGLRRRIFRVADFVQVEWRPNAELALKRSSVRYDSPGQ